MRLVAGVPLEDDLLEGLEGERPVDPPLADGIAEALQVALADEVPERNAVGIGDGIAVVRIGGIAAGDGEEAAVVVGDAFALQRRRRPNAQRRHHGNGEHREHHAQAPPPIMQAKLRHGIPHAAAGSLAARHEPPDQPDSANLLYVPFFVSQGGGGRGTSGLASSGRGNS